MTRKKAGIALALLLLSAAWCSGQQAPDWPRFRGPDGSGVSTETAWNPRALAGNPRILWTANVGIGLSNFSAQGDRLFTMGWKDHQDSVMCLDVSSGKEIWRYSYPRATVDPYGTQTTPVIDGEYLYALGNHGESFCLGTADGALLWKKNIVTDYKAFYPVHNFGASPVIDGDLLLLNANDSGIALDKRTGNLVWNSSATVTADLSVQSYATPTLDDVNGSRCALLFAGLGLYSVEVKTGKVDWFFSWDMGSVLNVATPVRFENKVLISSAEVGLGTLLDMAGDKPAVLWQNDSMRIHTNASVYIDGCLYGCCGDAGGGYPTSLRCVDAGSGEVKWEQRMKLSSVTGAAGRLIILDESGKLRIAETTPTAYTEISSWQLPTSFLPKWWTPPLLYRGRIYCRNLMGELVCIDVSSESE